MMQAETFLSGRSIKPFSNFAVKDAGVLKKLGIGFEKDTIEKMLERSDLRGMTMDSASGQQPSVTIGSSIVPIQFLQNWLPGLIKAITAKRKADELMGITTRGEWADEQIVQGMVEELGSVMPYGDDTNVMYNNYNTNWLYRSIIRLETGMRVGREELAKAAKVNIDSAAMKRQSAANSLEIERNAIGFYGFNAGINNTYGFLNDPFLPSYITVPNGAAASPLWSKKTTLEIIADIQSMAAQLQTQSLDNIDPFNEEITLALATTDMAYLTTPTQFAYSVNAWLADNFKKLRIVSAPELDGANGGANVAYLYADRVIDDSTDGGRSIEQYVPAKFMVLGVQQTTKGYLEDYTNATAGVLVKRPWAFVRYSGM
jgi:hypothetical protein